MITEVLKVIDLGMQLMVWIRIRTLIGGIFIL
jgi:hypothetical protein